MINTSSWRVVLEKIRRDDLGGVSGDLVWRGEVSLGVEAIGDDHRLHFLAVDDQVEDLRKKLTFSTTIKTDFFDPGFKKHYHVATSNLFWRSGLTFKFFKF